MLGRHLELRVLKVSRRMVHPVDRDFELALGARGLSTQQILGLGGKLKRATA